MSKKQRLLIINAVRQHGKIHLCGRKASWRDCFSCIEGKLCFWFNTDDGSTHLVMSKEEYSSASIENNLIAAN